MRQWYEELFDNYAIGYDEESFTQGTVQEVDFIEEEIEFDKSLRIIDVGCGTGRHAIELSKRGYVVTGIDLSQSQLERAKKKALQAGVSVNFLPQDARNLNIEDEFDVALLICEGAFPLMETDEMNYKILMCVRNVLKPNGKLILTTLNALYPLHHSVDEFLNQNSSEDRSLDSAFNLLTFRMTSVFEFTDDNGNRKRLKCNERYYVPSEINWLLSSLGFKKVEIVGCAPGQFSRKRQLTPDDFEMLVIAAC